MTMRSISSPDGVMRHGGPRSSTQLFPQRCGRSRAQALLKVPLYPYQAEGALFAVRAGRALIGDEMGLGKTIQAIAATEILARHFGVSKVLVVCPTSLKYQWQSEIARFSGRQGENAARVISGGRAQRQKDYRPGRFLQDHELREAQARSGPDRRLGARTRHRR